LVNLLLPIQDGVAQYEAVATGLEAEETDVYRMVAVQWILRSKVLSLLSSPVMVHTWQVDRTSPWMGIKAGVRINLEFHKDRMTRDKEFEIRRLNEHLRINYHFLSIIPVLALLVSLTAQLLARSLRGKPTVTPKEFPRAEARRGIEIEITGIENLLLVKTTSKDPVIHNWRVTATTLDRVLSLVKMAVTGNRRSRSKVLLDQL
jgi:hypothetical protein